MNRRVLLASLAAASVLGTRNAFAREPAAIQRLGLLMGGLPCATEAIKKALVKDARITRALAQLGQVWGRNYTVEMRCFEWEDFPRARRMAAELVSLRIDVLWTTGTPPTKALQEATKTIPIVTSVGDPVAAGFTESLARPSGNITGRSHAHPSTPAKEIELLRRVVPNLDRLVILADVRYGEARALLRGLEAAARAAGLAAKVSIIEPSLQEFERVFGEMKRSGLRAAYLQFADTAAASATTAMAIRHGVAAMYDSTEHVEHGGLIAFQMVHANAPQRDAAMIDKLFRGVRIADIPWELPDRSHIAINLRTAKALGLTVPADVLVRADQVVE